MFITVYLLSSQMKLINWMWKTRNDVFDSCVIHLAVLGELECLCALLIWKRVWTGVPKEQKCLLRAIAVGINVLVMTNELHLDE
jgi:hypothetical protein